MRRAGRPSVSADRVAFCTAPYRAQNEQGYCRTFRGVCEPFPKSETRRVSPLSSAGALYKTGCQGVNGGVVKRTSAEDSAFCDGWVGNSERRADGGRGAAGVPEGAARSAEPAAPRPPSETSAPRPDHSALLPHPSRDRTMSITCGDLSRNASLNRMGDR